MEASRSSECDICVEKFNLKSRSVITCVKCDIICCKQCFKRYITDPDHYFQCMGCNVQFDRLSLFERLGQSFMRTEFRDIRQSILYENEKVYFPATQILVEKELEVERLQEKNRNLEKKYEQIRKERMEPLKEFRNSKEVVQVCDALDRYLTLQANVEIVDEQLQEEKQYITSKLNVLEQKDSKPSVRTYVLACTNADCKGMLSNETKNQFGHYLCAICEHVTCRDCKMGISESDHTCDPDILKSVEFVQSNSKPCPSCGVNIHKISGCDAMFCTSCHASFHWKTMKLTNGSVHNPHQAEWLRLNRNRPREVGDIQCGRELSIDIGLILIDRITEKIHSMSLKPREMDCRKQIITKKEIDYLYDSIRVGVHHTHVTLPSLGRERYGQHTNQALRIKFLKGVIGDSDFKFELQRMDKANSKRQDFLQVVMTYRDSLTDIIWGFVDNRDRSLVEWFEMIKQIHALEDYVNGCFERISKVFGSSIVHNIMSDRSIY